MLDWVGFNSFSLVGFVYSTHQLKKKDKSLPINHNRAYKLFRKSSNLFSCNFLIRLRSRSIISIWSFIDDPNLSFGTAISVLKLYSKSTKMLFPLYTLLLLSQTFGAAIGILFSRALTCTYICQGFIPSYLIFEGKKSTSAPFFTNALATSGKTIS